MKNKPGPAVKPARKENNMTTVDYFKLRAMEAVMQCNAADLLDFVIKLLYLEGAKA